MVSKENIIVTSWLSSITILELTAYNSIKLTARREWRINGQKKDLGESN